MLRAMIQLAAWARRSNAGSSISPALAELRAIGEFPTIGERAYVIRRDAAANLKASPMEVDETTRYGFAFRRPSGPRSPQVGPVLKRSRDPKKGVAPNATTLSATLAHFASIASSQLPVAKVYADALAVLGDGPLEEQVNRLFQALTNIDEKKTVFVALGEPPGHNEAYAEHLLSVIRSDLYGIDEAAPIGVCPLCGQTAPLGWSALKGAKVNFLNADNHGVFPNLDIDRAGDRFSLCAACADAIATTYINLKSKLRVIVAGSPALVLPYLISQHPSRDASRELGEVLDKMREGTGTSTAEGDLLDMLAETSELANVHILWAQAGDSLDDVHDFITDVPCTRLAKLSAINQKVANTWSGGVLPTRRVRDFDLRLSLLGRVLDHPGGKRVERRNGERLSALRRQIARAVYLQSTLDERPLMTELRDIIADYLVDPTIDDKFIVYHLTHEPGKPQKPQKPGAEALMNAASWIRHAALLLHYLRHLGVLPSMATTERHQPRSERLRKLLIASSGVNTDEKAFAFLVGVLFGRLLTIQGARGVNVRSNALTWLRRGTLSGADLLTLHNSIRGKLIEYESERSPVLREVIFDTSALGARLGSDIPLTTDETMYFLFLGQALSGEVFLKEEKSDESDKEPS